MQSPSLAEQLSGDIASQAKTVGMAGSKGRSGLGIHVNAESRDNKERSNNPQQDCYRKRCSRRVYWYAEAIHPQGPNFDSEYPNMNSEQEQQTAKNSQ